MTASMHTSPPPTLNAKDPSCSLPVRSKCAPLHLVSNPPLGPRATLRNCAPASAFSRPVGQSSKSPSYGLEMFSSPPAVTSAKSASPSTLKPLQDHIPPVSTDRSKVLATLKAVLALEGYQLHEITDGLGVAYVICRWDYSREGRELACVAAFARQVAPHLLSAARREQEAEHD